MDDPRHSTNPNQIARVMGLDKLRCVTARRPGLAWFDMINADYRRRPEERQFNFSFRYRDQREVDSIGITAEVRIWTKPCVSPQYMVELNFLTPGGTQPPLTVFETNPNNYERGWPHVEETVDAIFTDDCGDLKNTRLDFNAEVEDVSVHSFRDSLRVPLKRASAALGKSPNENEVWARRGVETVYIGKSPSRLRVYDKIQELKFRGKDVTLLPAVLTRLEFELRGVRCPIAKFSDIPKLLQDCRPFASIQLKEAPDYYDYKTDPHGSMARLLYNKLVEDVGLQDATRIFNTNRNFSRNFKAIVFDNVALKRKIEDSYFQSNKRLLSGRGASVEHIYLHCAWCMSDIEVKQCQACGVRLCLDCRDLNEGHDETCPIRKENVN